MDSVEWAAAWFDAEGSIVHARSTNLVQIGFSNGDMEIMARFMAVVCPIVGKPGTMTRDWRGKRSTCFFWRTSGRSAQVLLEAFRPFLSQRRLKTWDWVNRLVATDAISDERRAEVRAANAKSHRKHRPERLAKMRAYYAEHHHLS